jgi:hypothetical protein
MQEDPGEGHEYSRGPAVPRPSFVPEAKSFPATGENIGSCTRQNHVRAAPTTGKIMCIGMGRRELGGANHQLDFDWVYSRFAWRKPPLPANGAGNGAPGPGAPASSKQYAPPRRQNRRALAPVVCCRCGKTQVRATTTETSIPKHIPTPLCQPAAIGFWFRKNLAYRTSNLTLNSRARLPIT